MQVRISTCKGALVAEESSEEVLGILIDILIHPDTGDIEGFYVQVSGGFGGGGYLFCRAIDVLRFGTRIYVRSADVLCDPYEIVRLHNLLDDGRRVLGQRIRTESGQVIGRCKDVQFNTEAMKLEWIFPKRLFRWKRGIAATDIIEVKDHYIVVRDAPLPILGEEEEHASVLDPIEIIEPKVSRVKQE